MPVHADGFPSREADVAMKVLVIDVGGTHVKILATGERDHREFSSGPKLTARQMVARVGKLAKGWSYDVVAMGYPGLLAHGRPVAEPHNLGRGWVGFDFQAAFGRRIAIVNDAVMQALGSYRGGKMLFLGLGTGLGSAKELPPGCRAGDDADAFRGGFRLWDHRRGSGPERRGDP